MVEPNPRARRAPRQREATARPQPVEPDFVPLDRVVGLDAARHVLVGALRRNALAGTYLLKGPTGVGKTTLAMAFAQAAACTSPADTPFVACGACMSCTLTARGTHPEVTLIAPSGDQTQIWQFWDRPGKPPGILERSLPFSPSIGARRVFIIERADTLNEAASNSLLKVLEEPPSYALFLLLTPNADRLLPTILSRCQVLALSPMPTVVLEQWLLETQGLTAERARIIAALAEGCAGTAKTLATMAGAYDLFQAAMDLTIQLLQAPPLRALKLSERMRQIGSELDAHTVSADSTTSEQPTKETGRARVERRGLGIVLDLMALTFRELMAIAIGSTRPSALATDHASFAGSHPELVHPARCARAIDVILIARRRLDQNVPPNLLTDWVAAGIVADRRLP